MAETCKEVLARVPRTIYTETPALRQLLTQLKLTGFVPKQPAEHTRLSVCSNDPIQQGFDKEEAKFRRNQEVLSRIDKLTLQRERVRANKLKQERTKNQFIHQEKLKKAEEVEAAAAVHSENRARHLAAKQTILRQVEQEIQAHGAQLEKRMAKLAEQQKAKLRQQLREECQRIRNWMEEKWTRQQMTDKTINEEVAWSLQLLAAVKQKQETRILL